MQFKGKKRSAASRGSWHGGHCCDQCRNEESAAMNIRIDRLSVPESDVIGRGAACATASVLSARAEGLNVEIVGPISLLPHGQKCGIHFGADATVTIKLGTGDYGHCYAAPYFASLLVARLGIPFKRIRLYYAGVRPAVRIEVRHTDNVPSRTSVGMANAGIGDLIEVLCDRAIAQGRRCLASAIGVLPADIDFDASSGRFVVGREQHVDILELANRARNG
jgi:hypothetical protein